MQRVNELGFGELLDGRIRNAGMLREPAGQVGFETGPRLRWTRNRFEFGYGERIDDLRAGCFQFGNRRLEVGGDDRVSHCGLERLAKNSEPNPFQSVLLQMSCIAWRDVARA